MLARAILRAVASGQPELTEKVASFHGAITSMIRDALNGGQRSNGATAADDAELVVVLQHVWFAALVGWAGGLHDQDEVIRRVRSAASMTLNGH